MGLIVNHFSHIQSTTFKELGFRERGHLQEWIANKESIESAFGKPLIWERLNDNVTARVKYELSGVSIFNEENWERMIEFMKNAVPKFETAFKKPIQELNKK